MPSCNLEFEFLQDGRIWVPRGNPSSSPQSVGTPRKNLNPPSGSFPAYSLRPTTSRAEKPPSPGNPRQHIILYARQPPTGELFVPPTTRDSLRLETLRTLTPTVSNTPTHPKHQALDNYSQHTTSSLENTSRSKTLYTRQPFSPENRASRGEDEMMEVNAPEVNITEPVVKEGRRKKRAVNNKMYRRHGKQSRGNCFHVGQRSKTCARQDLGFSPDHV